MSKTRKNNKNKSSSKLLVFLMFVFVILSILAFYIIMNKGKIGEYSLIQIETAAEETSQEEIEETKDTMEITAEKKYLSAKKKEETEFTVMVNDEPVDLEEVELVSSNEKVIKIKDGVAVAVSEGKATITAFKDDLTASVDLRAIIPITSIQFSTTNSTVRVDKSLQMKLVAKPSDASIETLKYESSDESIATVNSNGIVTGVSPGKVTIKVTDLYSEITKSVNLTIRK